MIVSRDEAEGLLSKWATDSNSVWVIVLAGGTIFSFTGSIKLLTSEAMVIAQGSAAEITIALGMFDSFEYGDVRELPGDRPELIQRVVCNLTLRSKPVDCYLTELTV